MTSTINKHSLQCFNYRRRNGLKFSHVRIQHMWAPGYVTHTPPIMERVNIAIELAVKPVLSTISICLLGKIPFSFIRFVVFSVLYWAFAYYSAQPFLWSVIKCRSLKIKWPPNGFNIDTIFFCIYWRQIKWTEKNPARVSVTLNIVASPQITTKILWCFQPNINAIASILSIWPPIMKKPINQLTNKLEQTVARNNEILSALQIELFFFNDCVDRL